ncbi:MAG: glycosyltransferase family 2 protein [Deltaproteobacteria bacterium]|nr:glycosyltransferase family 2 protein [Candidatus Anaeroferrophillacea bacterium]
MIDIVVVNYNAGALLPRCVAAALASTVPVRLLIVDNGSTDNSLELVAAAGAGDDARVAVHRTGANLGFGRAVNLGLSRTGGSDFLLVLNPDCLLAADTVAVMAAALAADPRAGLAGGVIRNADGTIQRGCLRRLPTPANVLADLVPGLRGVVKTASYTVDDGALPVGVSEVEAVSGSLMMVRRAALAEVGPLDERFFLHCEDLDWFMRFRHAGWKVVLEPRAEAVHYQGSCSRRYPFRVLWHKHAGMQKYYLKHYGFRRRPFLSGLMLAGIWGRFLHAVALTAARRGGGKEAGGGVRPAVPAGRP